MLASIPAGCVSASLASDTGPRSAGRAWSIAARHPAHVGETVDFDLVLVDGWGRFLPSAGFDEYAVLAINRERLETEPDGAGHFRFSYNLGAVPVGASVRVVGAVFRQRGHRDFINVQGEWLESNSPYERNDDLVAEDELVLDVYQTRIELSLTRPPTDLDPESGVLRILRQDGTVSTIYVDRPGRPGFILTGPEPSGYYTVTYVPDGDELNATGTTRIEFSIHDLSGQRHESTVLLDTP